MNKEKIGLINEVIEKFGFKDTLISVVPFGNGHINDTFLLTYKSDDELETKYILQRINDSIFENVDELMKNYEKICKYLKKVVANRCGDIYRETVTLINTTDGKSYTKDNLGNYWRAILFINNSITYEATTSVEGFYNTGKAFGNFQNMLAKYNVNELYESIPNFHNTKERYKSFLKAIDEDKAGRKKHIIKEIDFILKRKKDTEILQDMVEQGELPIRVAHNNTKISNVLMDKDTNQYLCIIDLDTVMPGLSLYDFGNAIRTGATGSKEDEVDLDKVYIDLNLFESFTKGFIEGANSTLTNNEIVMLSMGAKVITLEQGIRFLTDYLNGDVYYKTYYQNQNLLRTKTQLKLVEDIELKWQKLNDIIGKLYKV